MTGVTVLMRLMTQHSTSLLKQETSFSPLLSTAGALGKTLGNYHVM